tara:strand:+ start:214 stop:468 length:255 start_codon:yes stop_codon:yes gene_type:complete
MNRNFIGAIVTVLAVFTIIPIIPLVIAFLAGVILKRRIDHVPGDGTVDEQLYGQDHEVKKLKEGQGCTSGVWESDQKRCAKHFY